MSEKWKVGQVIDDRYELERVLGGGMGAVFVCYDRSRGRSVVLKTFKDRFLFDEKVVKRFSDEAAIWMSLGAHPNIVRAISVQNIDFRPYIVLERVRGDDRHGLELSGYIPEGGMGLESAVGYAMQFCAGMVHARRAASGAESDFVHGDIKPSNIFIGAGRTLKISDFGLSRSYRDRESAIEWGSFAYMPPEQFAGDELDARSDIYAFGCVLYEMIVGERPFSPPGGGREAYRQLHEGQVPVRPGARRRACPGALDEIIMACLEKAPSRRIPDFEALREALASRLAPSLPGIEAGLRERAYPLPVEQSHREILEKGIGFDDLGRFGEAIACFDSVLERSSDAEERYTAMCGRGSSLEAVGRHDEAAAAFESAMDLFPDRPFARMLRANLDNDAGRLTEALGRYGEALAIDGDYAICHYNRGICTMRLGRLDESLADFSRAIELGFTAAYANRGGIYRSLGRLEEALADYEAAISINPRNAIALSCAGSVYDRLGQHEQALACLARAIDVKPDYILPYFYRAEIEAASGLDTEAIADFETALAIDPTLTPVESGLKYAIVGSEFEQIRATIFHDCAVACLRAGENRKARDYLRRFVENALPLFEEQLVPARQTLARLDRTLEG